MARPTVPVALGILALSFVCGCATASGQGAHAVASAGTLGPGADAPPAGTPADSANLGTGGAIPGPSAPGVARPAPVGAPGAFGLSRESAVDVCMPGGEREYLAALRCPAGGAPQFVRRGNVGPRSPDASEADLGLMMDPNAVLPPGVVDGHIIDLYDVRCQDGTTVEVYMDMYHCSDPSPVQAVGPLAPDPAALAPPGSL